MTEGVLLVWAAIAAFAGAAAYQASLFLLALTVPETRRPWDDRTGALRFITFTPRGAWRAMRYIAGRPLPPDPHRWAFIAAKVALGLYAGGLAAFALVFAGAVIF